MKLWGLTGGIASGKSTVRRMLATRGADVIDADVLYHELIAPTDGVASPLALRIEDRFPGVLDEGGRLDRRELGRRVFECPAELLSLEALTHPAIAEAFGAQLAMLRQHGVDNVFYDVPLLYERGLEKGMNGVVLVWVPRDVQLKRLIRRDGLSEAQAKQRLDAQRPLDEKRALADWVIDNSGISQDTERQVDEVWDKLRKLPPATELPAADFQVF